MSPTIAARRPPGMGGFNLTVLGLEVRRLLRNPRTLIFSMVLPVVFFLIFGLNSDYASLSSGKGNVSAFVMISMALYGAVLATTSGGTMVSIERAAGWSRSLRLTPLSPAAYVVIKMLTALVLGAGSVIAVYAVGAITRTPSMPLYLWVLTGLAVWAGSLVFAAFGLFMGYLLPTENVMQILSFALVLFAFGGGLFIPLSQMSQTFQDIASYTPLYGLNELVHAPLVGEAPSLGAVVNVLAWLAIFTGGAVWRFRRDTVRV
ncbi:ABC transporter permease [Nakamurella antarctica]|uniref:ABC transporter permease n=1 Tax=Nakamurella antarctica TaxID=1902245 RepID=A0A3G8ZR64_9ACTN|nr:ABC transporter permease [Nakamurella antarctica]